MALEVGTQSPELEYENLNGETKSILASGEQTWVIFIPFAFTGVCQGEVCDIRDNFSNYGNDGKNLVIVTTDPAPSQKEWSDMLGYKGAWVSDFYPHGEISKRFDVFNAELGCANRVSYLIDENGKIAKVVSSGSLSEARDFSLYYS